MPTLLINTPEVVDSNLRFLLFAEQANLIRRQGIGGELL